MPAALLNYIFVPIACFTQNHINLRLISFYFLNVFLVQVYFLSSQTIAHDESVLEFIVEDVANSKKVQEVEELEVAGLQDSYCS